MNTVRESAAPSAERLAASNPFSTRWIRPGELPFQFPSDMSAVLLVDRLAAAGWRGAILGPHGSGKSTLLIALAPELESRGRRVAVVALHDGQRRLPAELLARFPCESATLLVVDGYEQLSWLQRWRLDRLCRRSGCGLLVTAHAATRLPEIFRTSPDEALARQLVDMLLHGDRATISPEDASRAFAAAEGDVREALFSLYDLYEQRRQSAAP